MKPATQESLGETAAPAMCARLVPLFVLALMWLATPARGETPLSPIEARRALERAQGLEMAGSFTDAPTLDSPNAAARYAVLTDLLCERDKGWRRLLRPESVGFDVLPNDAGHTRETLASELVRLRPWIDEWVDATNLEVAEWRLGNSAWSANLAHADTRRQFILEAANVDMILRAGARLALAEEDFRRAEMLTKARIRGIVHRFDWNGRHWLFSLVNVRSLIDVAQESALMVEALMQASDDRASVLRYAMELRDLLRGAIAYPRLDIRALYLAETRERLGRVRAWLSDELPDPLLEVSLDAIAPKRIMRTKYAADCWRLLELDSVASVLSYDEDPNERGVDNDPLRYTVLCSQDARNAVALSEQAITNIAAMWHATNGVSEVRRIEQESLATDRTWIARLVVPWPSRLCASERFARRSVQQSIDRLTNIANR